MGQLVRVETKVDVQSKHINRIEEQERKFCWRRLWSVWVGRYVETFKQVKRLSIKSGRFVGQKTTCGSLARFTAEKSV